ncbi:MAG: hypothetical protein BGO39_20980 [Chloroflexi bacterium 54-19]|nr:MAG: hypothetical protein BGO39_20980 [Chloroflexi bacterium 54-19]
MRLSQSANSGYKTTCRIAGLTPFRKKVLNRLRKTAFIRPPIPEFSRQDLTNRKYLRLFTRIPYDAGPQV